MAEKGPLKVKIAARPLRVEARNRSNSRAAKGTAAAQSSELGQRVETLGRRLRAELKQLIGALPATASTSAGLARWLGVSRPVCHRLLAGVRNEGDGFAVLTAMPGHEAVEQVVRAAEAKGVKRAVYTGSLIAAAEYADVIALAGGSQSKLLAQIQRLREDLALRGAFDGQGLGIRRGVHDAGVNLLGITCDACFTMYVLLPGEGAALQALHTMAWLGIRARSSHFPLVASRATDLEADALQPLSLEQARVEGFSPNTILGEFSSLPFPKVNSVLRGKRFVQHIDFAGARQMNARDGKDVVIGNRFQVSAPDERDGQRLHQVSVMPRVPTRRLVLDVYVHRSLGAQSLRACGIFYPGVEGLIVGDPENRWADRLDHTPDVTRPKASEPPEGIRIRYHELRSAMLAQTDSAAEEFDLFRLAIDYPLQGWQHLAELMLT